MPEAQLYLSGLDYTFNTHRMLFNRVLELRPSPELEPSGQLVDDQLYRVVTGMYLAQMLNTVEGKSFGLLSVVPKDAQGAPIADFSQHIVRDRYGNELKEWYALAAYLQSFGEDGLPDSYAQPDGRKEVSHS